MNSKDYCSYCRRITPHIKFDNEDEMLCKRCGRKEKRPVNISYKNISEWLVK